VLPAQRPPSRSPSFRAASWTRLAGTLCATLLATALAVPACGDGDGGLSQEDAPQAYAEAVCAALFECGCAAANAYTSQDACVLDLAADAQAVIDEGNAAGLTYSEACAGDLLRAFAALECSTVADLLVAPDLQREALALECKLFYGTVPAGGACTALADEQGDSCVATAECEGGVCAAFDVALPAGAVCTALDTCAVGLACLDVEGAGTSTCVALPSDGQTCVTTADLCGLDLVCDQATKTCEPLPGPGQPCAAMGNPAQLFARCRTGSYCDGSSTCQATPGAGEPCTIGSGCSTGLTCTAGVCALGGALVCAVD
jgi:hypothetical protein